MNTTTDTLQRINTLRTTDPTLPRRLTEREIEDHIRGMREAHDQAVEDAVKLFRARPHRRASDNDSRLRPEDRARGAAARAWHQKHALRQAQGDTAWWVTIVLLAGIFIATGAYHCGRYGCGA